jgi:hypothetical protein
MVHLGADALTRDIRAELKYSASERKLIAGSFDGLTVGEHPDPAGSGTIAAAGLFYVRVEAVNLNRTRNCAPKFVPQGVSRCVCRRRLLILIPKVRLKCDEPYLLCSFGGVVDACTLPEGRTRLLRNRGLFLNRRLVLNRRRGRCILSCGEWDCQKQQEGEFQQGLHRFTYA